MTIKVHAEKIKCIELSCAAVADDTLKITSTGAGAAFEFSDSMTNGHGEINVAWGDVPTLLQALQQLYDERYQ